MHQLHIAHYEFAQNELKVWYKSLLRLSGINLNFVFKFLSDVRKSQAYRHRILSQASRHSESSPKLMGRAGMDTLPYRMSSGDHHKGWY
jgi:hypothetical protein